MRPSRRWDGRMSAGPARTLRRYSSAVSVGGGGSPASTRSRISPSSSVSSRRRISASGRCSAWSRRIDPQPGEVSSVVLAARPRLPDRGQQPLGEVVAHGARGDAGQVGQFGQGVAFVVGHGAILTVKRATVKTSHEPEVAMPPPQRLHDRSPGCGADKVHGGPSTNQGVTSHASHPCRHPARRRPRDRWRPHRHDRLPGRSQHSRDDCQRQRRRRHPGRRPRLRLLAGAGTPASASSASSRRCSSCSSCSRSSARSSGAAARAGAAAGDPAAGAATTARARARAWETRGSQSFDEWHRRAHGETPPGGSERRHPADRHRLTALLPSSRAPGRLVRGRIPLYDATDEDHPRRRRRTEDRHPRPRLPRARGLRGADRRRRPVGAGHDPPAAARSGRARPRPARARRPRRHPRAPDATRRSRS